MIKSVIHWFVDNPIAANLLMIAMLLGGYFGSQSVEKTLFPVNEQNVVTVSAFYPSAAPVEVERQVTVRIEEAVADLPGIFQITSTSSRGSAFVRIEVIEGYDVRTLLNDIKARVDAVNTFPSTMERPVVSQQINRQFLVFFTIVGEVDPKVLKSVAYRVRDEMSLLEGVSAVKIKGMKADEVGIEISEDSLRRYNLTFDEVANAIRQSSLDLPAGVIRSGQGDIQIQTRALAADADDFANIVVRSYPDGGQLYLSDVATIADGFAEQRTEFSMEGVRGLDFDVFASDKPNIVAGTENVRRYIDELQKTLPEGLQAEISWEVKDAFDSRLALLTDNALNGLALVFLVLMLFLRPVLAFWVVVGIATAFAATLWALPLFGVSINMLSMFAFLLVLGIVVDDAIIVGESIHRHHQNGLRGTDAAKAGSMIVLKPVVLAVVSTIVLFFPMVTVPSEVLPYTLSIFFVVALALVFSLMESLLILPSHLAHLKEEQPSRWALLNKLKAVREAFSRTMERSAGQIYRPLLAKMLGRSGTTFIAFALLFGLSVSIVAGGWIPLKFFPDVPRSMIQVRAVYPDGSPFDEILAQANRIESIVGRLSYDEQLLARNGGEPFIWNVKKHVNDNNFLFLIGLTFPDKREVPISAIRNKLREMIGPLPEAKEYSLGFGGPRERPDIQLNLSILNNDRESQAVAVAAVMDVLASYPGVYDVRSDLDSERAEIELSLLPYAETLGISLQDISRQVRQGFYGEEIQRIPRAKEDVRVMLRYPSSERGSLDTLNQMRVRTVDGLEVPLYAVAKIDVVPGFTAIKRVDRKRNIILSANVDEGFDAGEITAALLADHTPEWKREFSGFQLSQDGNLRTQADFKVSLKDDFIGALVVILALFAIAFRSLFQPFLVLLAVPFGFMGAVFGHLVAGHAFSMFSFFGFLACAGVVVNDNLVLLDRINQLRQQGSTVAEAIITAGVDRFRPIVLTSLTTFVGLLPILFERSEQAQFLIPMVLSLSFGVLLSSGVTLLLVPCTYSLGERFKQWCIRLSGNLQKRLGVPGREIGPDQSIDSEPLEDHVQGNKWI